MMADDDSVPVKRFVWHDADGRILSSGSGPYIDESTTQIQSDVRMNPAPGARFLIHDVEFASPLNHYVKNGKVIPRPDLVPPAPGEPAQGVINLSSPAELPDLPVGTMVMLDNFALETMESSGKPSVIGEGTETVHVRIDAFPAKPAFFNVGGASRLPPQPQQNVAVAPRATSHKARRKEVASKSSKKKRQS